MEIPMQAAVNRPEANQYVFPAHWGGVTYSATPPMIHNKLRELRREVGSLGAKKQQGGPMFPVRSSKELMQKLAEALDALNLTAGVVAQDVTLVDTANIPDNKTSSGKPVFRTLAHVRSTVRIGAEDGSFVEYVGSGHGGDVDDKAGGKADTYAWKAAVLKGLCIPEQNMPDTDDEEPSERAPKSGAKPVKSTDQEMSVIANKGGRSLEAIVAQIGAANDEQLSTIVAGVKSGEIELKGGDKLAASAAVVKRRKELDALNKSKQTPTDS